MTFGAGGLAAGFLLLVVLVVLVGVFVLGLVLMVVGGSSRTRSLAWTGVVLMALPVVLVAGTVVWAKVTSDPATLRLDLRKPIAASALGDHKQPGFPAYTFDSSHVDLRLAHGDRLESEVDTITVWVRDGHASSVELSREASSLDEARSRVMRWARSLDVPTRGLAAATDDWSHRAGQDWRSAKGGRDVSLDITGRGHVVIWADVDVPDR